MASGTRQEQLTADPVVTEVSPGVLRMQLPIDLTGLGHVNCYALEDERGVALIDPGLPDPDTWAALEDRMAQAGIPLSRVHTVVVTHSHPDHFGLAGRLQQEVGAELLTHTSFHTWWELDVPDIVDLDDPPPVPENPWDQPTPWGSTTPDPPQLRTRFGTNDVRRQFRGPRPTIRVEDAEVVRLGRREWVGIHTPGHTPDHLCLLDPATGVLFSGDHVLPTITPHISGIGTSADPLAEFLASLDRMIALQGVGTVLPAHGHPFTDLPGRAADIKRHHEERLERLRAVSKDLGREATVEELSQHLFSERAWGRMAESETFAHLEHLRLAGLAECHDKDGVLLYSLG